MSSLSRTEKSWNDLPRESVVSSSPEALQVGQTAVRNSLGISETALGQREGKNSDLMSMFSSLFFLKL